MRFAWSQHMLRFAHSFRWWLRIGPACSAAGPAPPPAPPCAEVVMLRALPQVAELLLPSPSEERWAETEGVWLEPGRLYKQHLDFLPKLIPSL